MDLILTFYLLYLSGNSKGKPNRVHILIINKINALSQIKVVLA